ncbi:hypothetical protein MXC99_01940 [Thauera aromatica]|uniref:hypothetical protein n=1 Tax=Thauera aromatica TaxID=59405 RepID=UPI001FFCA4DD|nr:hypothetical protein [Thauera aromatica]MCK2086950.1 hypothetical protein [Thauera aromatica]
MQTSAPITAPDRTVQNLRRRLERWELDHLRRLAAELQERLDRALDEAERAKEERDRAWESAASWQRHAENLQQELWEAGGGIGITQDGDLLVAGPAKAAPPAERDALLASLDGVLEIADQVIEHAKLTRDEQRAFANARELLARIKSES